MELIFDKDESSLGSKIFGMFGNSSNPKVITDKFKVTLNKINYDDEEDEVSK